MKKIILSAVLSFFLTACSTTMRGTVQDGITKEPIPNSQIEIHLTADGEEIRTETTNEEGQYRIKKEGDSQKVIFKADGYEEKELLIEKETTYDIDLWPTAQETAQRILKHLQNNEFDQVYTYLHPNYQELYTKEDFLEINTQSGYNLFMSQIEDYTIENINTNQSYRDENLKKTYKDVTLVIVSLTLKDKTSSFRPTMVVPLIQENVDGVTYWRWVMNRTTNAT